MKMVAATRKSARHIVRVKVWMSIITLGCLADASGVLPSISAQSTVYSSYIPTAVPTATSMLYTSGTTSISPGRVTVDKAGNTFYVAHAAGATSTLFEISAASPVVTVATATALITGLGSLNSNTAFVDASGSLWVSNGNGPGVALIEIPASNGIPNTASLTGVTLSSISTACTAAPTSPCVWSAGSIGSLSSLQVGDVYSDGAGNIDLVDSSDSVSAGGYNRVVQFKTSAPGTLTVLADHLTTNPYAEVTIAGDGSVYYCDSVTGNTGGGLVSVISSGSLTTVANLPAASLTLANAIVKVPAATGIAADPWGDLIISGPLQLAEVPLENGVLNFADEFNLLVVVSGANAPTATNNITYGGSVDVHGNYYYASATSVMQIQVGGYNFGRVNVGTEVTTAAPYLNITWDLPSYLEVSGVFPTASPSTISAANAAYLQSFPYSNTKSYSGGTPYSASTTGQYIRMYFQPVHPGSLFGSVSPQGYINGLAKTSAQQTAQSTIGLWQANLQGVGVGPHPMFVPGTASKAITLAQLYTSASATTKAPGFVPQDVAVDTLGDIFVADSASGTLDIECLATTANTSQNYGTNNKSVVYTNSYCNNNGVGYTFQVSGTIFVTPIGVVLDGTNSAYVLDSGAGTPIVTKFAYQPLIASTVIPTNASVAGIAILRPQGIAIDGYANLYISDTGNSRIIQGRQYDAAYSQNIVYVSNTQTFGGLMLNSPTGLGLDANGNLYIADTGNRRVVEYSVTGVTSVVATTGVTLVSPTAVKVLPSGALIVSDTTLGLILVDNGTGTSLTTGAIALGSTMGFGLDLAGNVYVADPLDSQVVELNFSAPANATPFPNTLRGSATSTETSFIYNSGNAQLTISAVPTVVDNTNPTLNEFKVESNNSCTANTAVAAGSSCSLMMDFTPAATDTPFVPIGGTATVADNLQSYTLIANPATSAEEIGSFGTAGSTQAVLLTGQAAIPSTPQTITFTTSPTTVTYSSPIPPITLSAIGGGSGNPIVFSILSGKGATLSGLNNSILTLTQIGTVVIQASQAGGLSSNGTVYYAAATATESIVVNPIGTVATPSFSVPTGTYTAVQSVTISDASPNVTIYYTTNGNTPTISSSVYTGTPIVVGITTTIEAIAVSTIPGYANSAVASATYTLNPDFTLSSYQTSFNIPNGNAGSATLTVTPLFGFTGTVSLSCTGLYKGDTCSFLNAANASTTSLTIPPGSVTLTDPTGAVYGTLLIQSNESASLRHPVGGPFKQVVVLAAVLVIGCLRKRRLLLTAALCILSAFAMCNLSGCSDASTTGKTHTSTFMLTGTSGSVVHTITITLDVNNL